MSLGLTCLKEAKCYTVDEPCTHGHTGLAKNAVFACFITKLPVTSFFGRLSHYVIDLCYHQNSSCSRKSTSVIKKYNLLKFHSI